MTKTVIPTGADELEEMLGDSAQIQNLFKENRFGEFVRNYAKATMAKDATIGQQVREETQLVLNEWLKAQQADGYVPDRKLNLSASGKAGGGKGALYNKKAPGAAVDNEYEGSADFFQTIWHHASSLQRWDETELHNKLNRIKRVQNSFGSTVPADGGYLIPETLRSELLQVALESAVVRPRARVIPMESLRVPIPMIDSTSNASSVFGGIVCYWTEEGASLTESQASFGRVVLEAKKLTGYAEAPNELVADATAFGAFFDQVFPAAIAWYEDAAFMSGTGVGEPLGFLNSGNGAAVEVAKESGQTASTIVWENIVKMYARMLPSSLANAVWIASIDTFPELATMALSVGTGGSAVWLNNGADGPPMTILGRPVIFTEKAETLGNAGDLNFVDLGYYLVGDRQVMQAMSSPHYKFASDKTAYRIVQRVDGRPWIQSAITPKNGGSTLSPFVKIADRA